MKERRTLFGLVLIFLIFFFFSLICIFMYLQKELESGKKLEEIAIAPEKNEVIDMKPLTKEDILNKYQTQYISRNLNEIFVSFGKDLYSENGDSNKIYFESMINDLIPFFKPNAFYLIDEEKRINIQIEFDEKSEEYVIIINNINTIDEFYSKTDGDSYAAVDNSKIVDGKNMITDNIFLTTLQITGYFSTIKSYLGEGIELENGYTSYLDGLVKLRTVPTGAVRNIIFSDDYNGKITTKIQAGMSLSEINELEPEYDFGGINHGYLGYRQAYYYLFFYENEISAYTYSYKENTQFEKSLKEYIETKNLDNFANELAKKWKSYDYMNYDKENGNLYMLYSARGVEIDIKNNNPAGIKLYTNYYLTDLTKSYVKNGIINFNESTDLIHKVELERRNNK